MKDFTEKCIACNGVGGSLGSGVCHDCYGQGEIPDDGAKLDAYDKREPLVLEVIRLHKNFCTMLDGKNAPMGILADAGRQMRDALDKLAEWKP